MLVISVGVRVVKVGVVSEGDPSLALRVVLLALSIQESTEQLVEQRVLIGEIFLSNSISVLERIYKDYTEREPCANEQDSDVHKVEVLRNVVRVALMS